jgi:hypothetical protein
VLHLPYDVAGRCALCGAEDCAEFIGWYHREVIDEDGTYFKAFPIARFECHRKNGAPVVNHRTFSLLPYQLVPYVKYSLPFIIKGLRSVFGEGTSVKRLLDYLAASEEGYIDLSGSSFYRFRTCILRCIDKMLVAGVYHEAEALFQLPEAQRIKVFVGFAEEFICHKTEYPIRGPCALGYDFYLTSGGYFLFGTPSQHR